MTTDNRQTLILSPRYTPDSIALAGEAAAAGWRVERLSSWRAPAYLSESHPVIYGEPLFVAAICEELSLAAFEPPFSWLANVPYQYRLREVEFADLDKARRRERPSFIKPADDKCFQAAVYHSGGDLPSPDALPGATPVLISEPVSWAAEFRTFVLHKQALTISVYSRNGDLAQSPDGDWQASQAETAAALDFAISVLSDNAIPVPPSVVLDVGLIPDRGWAVVEANAAWASGIYGCHPATVLHVLTAAFKHTSDLSAEDMTWIPTRNTYI
jgi:hypothetical protein